MQWRKAVCVEKIYTWFIQKDITENITVTCYSGSNKWHDLKKSVPQRGVKPWPLTIRVSFIPLDHWDTHCHIHPSRQKPCNSGSNKRQNLKTSVPQRGVKPWPLVIRASIIPLDHRDTHCHITFEQTPYPPQFDIVDLKIRRYPN